MTVSPDRAPAPQKWRKYELLHLYGLADLGYLRRTIHRVPRSEHSGFLAQLRKAVCSAHRDGRPNTLFVVKFVPMHVGMMLPNVRVTCIDDLEIVQQAIEHEPSDYVELWFCQTDVSPSSLSVAGRFTLDAGAGAYEQVIEQVWRCSPRLIEALGPQFRYPFVRARRYGWHWSAKIDEMHLPRGVPETSAVLRRELGVALARLGEIKDQLELFCNTIRSIGLSVYVEYKLEGRRLQIIDWDTPDDGLVLAKLLPVRSAGSVNLSKGCLASSNPSVGTKRFES